MSRRRTKFIKSVFAYLALPLLLVSTEAARSQTTPDVPSGSATLRGEIVYSGDASRQSARESVEVLLYALPSGGTPGIRTGQSDAAGRFAFEGISNDPETVYLVGARYRGVPFPGARVRFAAGSLDQQVSVRIGEVTSSSERLRLRELEIRFALRGGLVEVTETYRLNNESDLTLYVAEDERERTSLFSMTLPKGAADFGSAFGLPLEGADHRGSQVDFYGPVYPSAWGGSFDGPQEISVRYSLPATGDRFELDRPIPRLAEQVVIFETGALGEPSIEGAERREIDGEQAFWLEGDALRKSVVLRATLPKTEERADALARRESRVFLEFDGAALQVREEHLFRIEGDAPVVAPQGSVLLETSVPEGAVDVRFNPQANQWGLEVVPGALRLAGPIPAGEGTLELAYQLAPQGSGATYEALFHDALPLLNVFVADTGIAVESERLHRRRPVRSGTRTYAHWEAFQIAPDERVAVALRPLAAVGPGRSVVIALTALCAAICAYFLFAPLGRGRRLETVPIDPRREEREAIYQGLRDLEHDFETGKLSDEDYQSMRGELRARAALSMRERAPIDTRSEDDTQTQPITCDACNTPATIGDRFCSHCGAALGRAR